MSQASLASPAGGAPRYGVGLDGGSDICLVAVLAPDKRVVRKPFEIATAGDGFTRLAQQLAQLGCAPHEILIGLEATGRYWENLYYFLHQRGYRLVLLHPAQPHHFAERRGLRAKTGSSYVTASAGVSGTRTSPSSLARRVRYCTTRSRCWRSY
jgi:hypothetical protein